MSFFVLNASAIGRLPMFDLHAAARALGGEASNGQILCPGPMHSRADRSLSVKFLADAPQGFLVNSFAGDDPRACRDHVKQLLGLSSGSRISHHPAPQKVPESSKAKERHNQERALAIWAEAISPEGTIVETYLASRTLSFFFMRYFFFTFRSCEIRPLG